MAKTQETTMKAISVENLTKYLLIASASMLIALNSFAVEKDKPAPNFTLKSNSGENIRLSELRGQVVMVNFWATWCGPVVKKCH